ncbi:MAG: hypothetical protein ACI9R3_006572 [Verrucomicrobiales bacterium]
MILQRVEAIISGGQTGADRAALDWALGRGVPHHGWCPEGRLAEDGAVPDRYRLEETPHRGYIVRTEWNVRDSDGTVIFTLNKNVTGGSLATLRFARKWNKPCIHIARDHAGDAAQRLAEFVINHRVSYLNVAGPRASGVPEIGAYVYQVLEDAFGESQSSIATDSTGLDA